MKGLQRDLFLSPRFMLLNGQTLPSWPARAPEEVPALGAFTGEAICPIAPQPSTPSGEVPSALTRSGAAQQDLTRLTPGVRELKFSIVTACQNNVRSIGACLASVDAQCQQSLEHVVVDLDSSDGSLQRILRNRHRLTIVFGRHSDSLFDAWNRGICHTTGDVVGFLNATDVYPHPQLLSGVARAFSDPGVSAVFGNVHVIQKTPQSGVLNTRQTGDLSAQQLRMGWAPPLETMFVRRAWLDQIQRLSPQLSLAADFDAVRRLFALPGFRAVYLDTPVVSKRPAPSPWREPRRHLLHAMERLACLRRLDLATGDAAAPRSIGRLFYMLRHMPPVARLDP
ncbi:glycosyltransferase [Hydrogenophaga sp.]|uniref:glycosyltransferase n=1 Tax=Hydrogenophaga sp. TaxID=1904254 RepID=UPI00286DBF6F|nr:glycosyltransferase [Hydrogenophaga sp.]